MTKALLLFVISSFAAMAVSAQNLDCDATPKKSSGIKTEIAIDEINGDTIYVKHFNENGLLLQWAQHAEEHHGSIGSFVQTNTFFPNDTIKTSTKVKDGKTVDALRQEINAAGQVTYLRHDRGRRFEEEKITYDGDQWQTRSHESCSHTGQDWWRKRYQERQSETPDGGNAWVRTMVEGLDPKTDVKATYDSLVNHYGSNGLLSHSTHWQKVGVPENNVPKYYHFHERDSTWAPDGHLIKVEYTYRKHSSSGKVLTHTVTTHDGSADFPQITTKIRNGESVDEVLPRDRKEWAARSVKRKDVSVASEMTKLLSRGSDQFIDSFETAEGKWIVEVNHNDSEPLMLYGNDRKLVVSYQKHKTSGNSYHQALEIGESDLLLAAMPDSNVLPNPHIPFLEGYVPEYVQWEQKSSYYVVDLTQQFEYDANGKLNHLRLTKAFRHVMQRGEASYDPQLGVLQTELLGLGHRADGRVDTARTVHSFDYCLGKIHRISASSQDFTHTGVTPPVKENFEVPVNQFGDRTRYDHTSSSNLVKKIRYEYIYHLVLAKAYLH